MPAAPRSSSRLPHPPRPPGSRLESPSSPSYSTTRGRPEFICGGSQSSKGGGAMVGCTGWVGCSSTEEHADRKSRGSADAEAAKDSHRASGRVGGAA